MIVHATQIKLIENWTKNIKNFKLLDGKYSKFQAFISLQLKVQMYYNEK
jgi:hypothetical protein